MSNNTKTIALAGGGTAGHIVPHLAALPLLKQRFSRIIYFSSGKEIEKKLFFNSGAELFGFNPPAFSRSLKPSNLAIPFKLAKAVKDAMRILEKTHTDVVFSKGGYCALPVCIAAKKLNIPYVCHESDLSLGLANKLTYKSSRALLTVFPETAEKYGGICVGPPIRSDLDDYDKATAKKLLGTDDKKPLLLVTGGSQGSAKINGVIRDNLTELTKRYYVLHLTGEKDKAGYKSINGYFPIPFGDMRICLSACDICISRGGSNTLFELLYKRVPCVIVPLKKSSRGDQQKNAGYFLKKNALICCDEDDLSDNVISLCDTLIKNYDYYRKNIETLGIKNGTKEMVKHVLNCVRF